MFLVEKGLPPQHSGAPIDLRRKQQPQYAESTATQKRVSPQQARPLTKLTHFDLSPDNPYVQLNQVPKQQASAPRTHQPTNQGPRPNQGAYAGQGIKLESQLIELPVKGSDGPRPPTVDSVALKQGMGNNTGYSGLPYSPRQQRKFEPDQDMEANRKRSRSFGSSFGSKFGAPRDSLSFNRSVTGTTSSGDPKHSTPVTSTSEMPSLPYSSLTQQGESSLAVDSPSYPDYDQYNDLRIPDYRFSRPEDYMKIGARPPIPGFSEQKEAKIVRPHSYAPPSRVATDNYTQRPASYVQPTDMTRDQFPEAAPPVPPSPQFSDGLVYAKLAFVRPEAPQNQFGNAQLPPRHQQQPEYTRQPVNKEDYRDNQYQNLPWHKGVDSPMPRAKSMSAFTQYTGRQQDMQYPPPDNRRAIDDSTLRSTGSGDYNVGSLTRSKSGSHIYDNPEASADLLRAKAKALTYYNRPSPPRPLMNVQHQKSQSWSVTEGNGPNSPPVSTVSPLPRTDGPQQTPRGRGTKSRAVADLRSAFQNAADAADMQNNRRPDLVEGTENLSPRPHSITLPPGRENLEDEWLGVSSNRPRSLASAEETTVRVVRERSRTRDRSRDRTRDRSRSKSRDRSRSRDRSHSRSRDRLSGIADSDEEWPPRSGTITIPGKEDSTASPQRPQSIATSTASPATSTAKAGILRNGASLPSSPVMQRRPAGTITIPGRSLSAKELNKLSSSKTDLDQSPRRKSLTREPAVDIPERPKSISIPAHHDSRQHEEVNWTNKRPKSVTIMEFPTHLSGLSTKASSGIESPPESPNIRKLNLNDLDRPYRTSSNNNKDNNKSSSQASLRSVGSAEPRFQVLPWIDMPELRNQDDTRNSNRGREGGRTERNRNMDPARSYLSWTGDSQGLGVSPWAEPEPLKPEENPRSPTGPNVRAAKSMESLSSSLQRQQQATVRPMNWKPVG